MIKAGIIGTGIGLKHFEAINNYRGSKVISILEKNKKKSVELKKKYKKVIITQDENDFFKNKELNLISIASYDQDHYKQILRAIKNNCHIIVEKPMCLSQKELLSIHKELKKKPKIKMISNLVLRENTLFKELKKRINKKKIYHIEASYLWGRKEKLFGWRSKVKNYSLTLGAAIHILDLICWMLNSKPVSVFGKANNKITKNSNFKKFSFANYIFSFPNGIIVNLKADSVCIHPHFHELKIFQGDKTFISNINGQFNINKIGEEKFKINQTNFDYPDKKNRSNLIKKFILAILDNKKVSIPQNNIFNVMKACFYADLSIKQGKEIKIRY